MNLRAALVFIVLCGSALAQKPVEPGPEVKKLDFFVGTWVADGTISSGPWGAGGNYTKTHKFEWMTGNFALLNRTESKMPAELGGDIVSISLIGYDVQKKAYIDAGFDNRGGYSVTESTLSGDTWISTSSEKLPDGQVIQQRETTKMLSPNSYRAKFEVSKDGTNWQVMMDSIVTKK